MHANTLELIRLIKAHNLSTKSISIILGRKPQTVRHWRSKTGFRVIPDHQLELLRLKLANGHQAGAL